MTRALRALRVLAGPRALRALRAPRALRALAPMALALAASACAESGVLELQVMMPPAPAGADEPIYGVVEVRRASTHPLEIVWGEADPEGVALGAAPQLVQRSVIGRDESIDLHVKIRFCASPTCTAVGDDAAPELRYAIGHPFYVGRRTAWATCVDAVPDATPPAITIDRCDVHGCIEGTGAAGFCDGTEHFCETGAEDVPPRELRCLATGPDY